MTIQVPDKLIVENDLIDISGLRLYGVLVRNASDPQSWSGYPFVNKIDPEKRAYITCCHYGAIRNFRLKSDGVLVLESFDYVFSDRAAPDNVHETLHGDFWLDLRKDFMGEAVRVPFRNGRVVTDRSSWIKRPSPLRHPTP